MNGALLGSITTAGLTALWKEARERIKDSAIWLLSSFILKNWQIEFCNRLIGLFRPTKPKAKILQNLLQSHEIRFGDAFEEAIEEYFKEFGYQILEKKFVNGDNDELNLEFKIIRK